MEFDNGTDEDGYETNERDELLDTSQTSHDFT